MATIAQRINEALIVRNMKQADLVRTTGIGKSSISTYLSGEYEPKQKNIYKIALALNVNEAWLMGYDVPMDRERPTPVSEDGLNKSAKAVLDACSDFTIDEWREMLHFAEYLVSRRTQGKGP